MPRRRDRASGADRQAVSGHRAGKRLRHRPGEAVGERAQGVSLNADHVFADLVHGETTNDEMLARMLYLQAHEFPPGNREGCSHHSRARQLYS